MVVMMTKVPRRKQVIDDGDKTDEIDKLFSNKMKEEGDKRGPGDGATRKEKLADRARFGDPSGKLRESGRRYTDDGLPIYSWNELISRDGGDTPNCPFDCQCCY